MYLIKKVRRNLSNDQIEVVGGIEAKYTGTNTLCLCSTHPKNVMITLGKYANLSKLPKQKDNFVLITYASRYGVREMSNEDNVLEFFLTTYEPGKVEGYLLFLEQEEEYQTDGKRMESCENVIELAKGQFLQFSGKRIEVDKNNQLVLFL